MLILTRAVDETLMIGDDIQITVLGVKGNQVRIGITAPNTLQVDREEIYLRKLQERQQSQPNAQPTIKHKRRRYESTQTD